MEWVLLIYVYAGILAKGDSVALTTIPGYVSREACESSARDLPKLVKGTAKEVVYVCLTKPVQGVK
mgnify:FL=1|jgi:hypothetical protein